MKQYIFKEGYAQNINFYGQDSMKVKGEFIFEEGIPYLFTFTKTKKDKRYGFKRCTLLDWIKSIFVSYI